MKKVITLSVSIVMMIVMCITSYATDVVVYDGNTYDVGNKTIIFKDDCVFSPEEQLQLAKRLAGEDVAVASPDSLVCLIMGHDIEEASVTMIEHYYRVEEPRCLERDLVLKRCTRCDFYEEEELGYRYVDCCH